MALENLVLKERERQLKDENAQLWQHILQLTQQLHEKDATNPLQTREKPSAPLPSVKVSQLLI